ncbi:MAG TPA: NUDIX-like domain-containing protein, partial [Actinopolymorphaceae bacterium]|nr:NUDIX-like domain-containing protein [Actinopolymorphaceae bacterium]
MPRLSDLALARSALDRATERRRNAGWVDARWADPRCRVLVVTNGTAPVDDDCASLVFSSPASLDAMGVAPEERYLLGLDADGIPYFAVPGSDPIDDMQSASAQSPATQSASTQSPATQSASTQSPATQSASTQSPATQSSGISLDGTSSGPARTAGLREARGLLSDRDAGVFVHAVALANWHAAHPCCARCGTRTAPTDGGHVRRC